MAVIPHRKEPSELMLEKTYVKQILLHIGLNIKSCLSRNKLMYAAFIRNLQTCQPHIKCVQIHNATIQNSFNAVTETSKFSYLFEPRVNHDRRTEAESFEGIKHITTTRNILDHIHQIQSLKPTSMDLTK